MIGDEAIKTGFTTPEAPALQALLAVMRERGADSVAMEVSSHALAMGRVDGIGFEVGAFTNLSQDHLDFHAGHGALLRGQARLFDGRSRSAVVMVDDEWGRRLAAELAGRGTVTVSTTGVPATWRAVRTCGPARTAAPASACVGPGVGLVAGCSVPGAFNVANAALACRRAARGGRGGRGGGAAPCAAAQVPGRMERVDAGQPFLAVVDYSHKPAAVAGALARAAAADHRPADRRARLRR